MEAAQKEKLEQSLSQKLKDKAAATNSVAAQITKHQADLDAYANDLELLTSNITNAQQTLETELKAADEAHKVAKHEAKDRHDNLVDTIRAE